MRVDPPRRPAARALVAVLFVALVGMAAAVATGASGRDVADALGERRRFLIELADGSTPVVDQLRALGIASDAIAETYDHIFPGAAATMTVADAARLAADAHVLHIEPDGVAEVAVSSPAPSQVSANDLPPWGLDRIDQPALPLSRSPYTAATSGSGVTAYVIDSGINRAHVQFGGRIAEGANLVPDTGGTNDCNGHGTHVSGILGAEDYGVAPTVTIVPVRVFGVQPGSENCSQLTTPNSVLLAGLDWVAEDHQPGRPAVANLSVGGSGTSQFVARAVRALAYDGIIVVAAAGNKNEVACASGPAQPGLVIVVAASKIDDTSADFNNSGPCIDLYAPGHDIWSTWIATKDAQGNPIPAESALAKLSGTSMAVPHVSGAVANLLVERPTWDSLAVSTYLIGNAVPAISNAPAGTTNRLLHQPPGGVDSVPWPTVEIDGPASVAGATADRLGIVD